MIDNLTIVRTVYSGLSQRQVAATHHVCPETPSHFSYGMPKLRAGLI